ncbi:MAG TPA: extracellular solute-binding protein [Candidatus Atribacteria bacterium]|nr:extracellular solute-binding protein [Candidatus Atribacteria bacterium]
MKSFQKVVILIVVLLFCISTAACSNLAGNGDNKKNKTKVTLAYWNTEETMAPFLKLLEEELEDIEVEYNYVENQFYGTAIKTKLTAGEGDDIMAFAPLDVYSLSSQDQILDLTEKYGDIYVEAGKVPYTFDGKLYAIPMLSWYEGIFYNKTIFEENNISVPTTFDEWISVCDKLDALGIKPLTIGAKNGSTLLKSCLGYVTAEYLLSDNGNDFDSKFSKGEASLSGTWDPYIRKWKTLIDKGYINTNMLGIDDNQALDEFATGKAAMWASGPWSYSTIKQKNINLKFDMFPYLGDEPENSCLVGSPGAGFVVNSNSKVKEAVFKVLDLMSTEKGQKALLEGNPGSSSYLIGVESELPVEYTSVKQTLELGRVYCAWENWGIATNCFNVFTQNLQGLVANRITIEEMLQEIDKTAMSFIRGEVEQ